MLKNSTFAPLLFSGALFALAPVLAQPLSYGVRAGIPATSMLNQGAPPRFTAGPSVEFHLWRGIAAGADIARFRAGAEVT